MLDRCISFDCNAASSKGSHCPFQQLLPARLAAQISSLTLNVQQWLCRLLQGLHTAVLEVGNRMTPHQEVIATRAVNSLLLRLPLKDVVVECPLRQQLPPHAWQNVWSTLIDCSGLLAAAWR